MPRSFPMRNVSASRIFPTVTHWLARHTCIHRVSHGAMVRVRRVHAWRRWWQVPSGHLPPPCCHVPSRVSVHAGLIIRERSPAYAHRLRGGDSRPCCHVPRRVPVGLVRLPGPRSGLRARVHPCLRGGRRWRKRGAASCHATALLGLLFLPRHWRCASSATIWGIPLGKSGDVRTVLAEFVMGVVQYCGMRSGSALFRVRAMPSGWHVGANVKWVWHIVVRHFM